MASVFLCLVGFLCGALNSSFLMVGNQMPGGSPAATHFSCFAKKSKQKKATAQPLPFGFPFVQIKKWEVNETRYARTTFTSFSIFCFAQKAASQRVRATAISKAMLIEIILSKHDQHVN
ncbi:hypothetical protein; putative exported protein [Herminiimonas arsenicoxydans]|uniref:Secreted protein n=1 Tax=Herminiimonas arsenicoxydans TaxID=204773 RepID=A4G3H7_HERAR|nr:hypothetical protein; putative exported protein [Herminiimonas arsenicoxydans]